MSLIWKPEDPDRAPPKVIVNRSHAPRSQATSGGERVSMGRYGIVDTTFSSVDMGAIAIRTLQGHGIPDTRLVRRTVPGFKDLAVAAKLLAERDGCAIILACGMVGPEPIDKQCGHESSLAIGQAQLMTSTHILEVFVHMDEARSDAELIRVVENRVSEHATNAYWLLERPEELLRRAGTGQRQGFEDVGAADPDRRQGGHLRPAPR